MLSSRVHADFATSEALILNTCVSAIYKWSYQLTRTPPIRSKLVTPQPRHKIGIEFLQLLVGFQLVWTTGQQHIAVPRLIQPEAVAEMHDWWPKSFAMVHLIQRQSKRKLTKKLNQWTSKSTPWQLADSPAGDHWTTPYHTTFRSLQIDSASPCQE